MDICMDESGFNGEDLLGSSHRPGDDSRAFVLATVAMDEQECKELKAKHFGRVQAPSLKHTSLARRPSGRALVLGYMRELALRPGKVRVYVAHKKFCLARKLVDLVVERVFHDDGIDLYEDSQDVQLASAIHFLLPAFEGRPYLDGLLAAFQHMMRDRTQSSLNGLATALGSKAVCEESRRILAPVFKFVRRYDAASFFQPSHKNALDVSLTSALSLMSDWRGTLGPGVPIRLVHDRSSNMAKQSSWWDFLNDPGRPEFVEAGADRIVFPAAIDETVFVDDEDCVGVQLADVAAGAAHRASSWSARGQDPADAYGRELMEIIGTYPEEVVLPMWPDQDVLTGKLSLADRDASRSLDYFIARAAEFVARGGSL